MSGRWSRWVRWVSYKEPDTPLALFRIAVGLVIFYTHAMLLATGGVVIWEHRDWGGIYPLSSKQWLLELLGGPIPPVVYGLITAGIVSACTLTDPRLYSYREEGPETGRLAGLIMRSL